MKELKELALLAEKQWQKFGHETPLEGLRITREETPRGHIHAVYRPSLCVVLQGAKISTLGNSSFHYRAGQCLMAKVSVPVTAQIVEASAQVPYLAFSLGFDPAIVTDLLVDHAASLDKLPVVPALQADTLPSNLFDPLNRLLALLDEPTDLPVLAPLIIKELIWRLLSSSFADALRQIGLRETHTARIGQVTAWLRENYQETVTVAALAEIANMSVASFHRHFKSVTQMSPVQFQKQIRLQEARKLLLSHQEVAVVGYQVGYESPSQFSRDYRRLFGAPPGKDKAILRSSLAVESVG